VSISGNFDTDSLRHSESLEFHVLYDRNYGLQSTAVHVLLAIVGHYFPTFSRTKRFFDAERNLLTLFVH